MAGRQDIALGQKGARRAPSSGRGGYAVLLIAVALLMATNALTALALYFTPELDTFRGDDDSGLIAAYEQRITQLRLEVDRLHSRQYAQMGDMNLQMHELVQQQEVLAEQHEYVRALTEMARELGIAEAGAPPSDPLLTGAVAPSTVSTDTAILAQSLIAMQDETRMALVSLSDAATLSANEIAGQLRSVGIDAGAPAEAMGGPFIPVDDGNLSIIDEANAVAQALSRYKAAREALIMAPVRVPIEGAGHVTSRFGTRTDPFLNRPAFHAGIDFRATTGTPVLSAAAGTVAFAGANGGYGNMVEIDHGNGLSTRYAHLSRVGVTLGQPVEGGDRLGLAGSTGRSTGPHLHFEVHRNGGAVDPARFIATGKALERFL